MPIVLLPIAGVAHLVQHAGDAWGGNANVDFTIAGQVVDESGAPIPSVVADVVAWVATHRDENRPDRWEQRSEQHVLGSKFVLDLKHAQALDMVIRTDGYARQRIVVISGSARPPSVEVVPGTSQSGTSSQRFKLKAAAPCTKVLKNDVLPE